MGYQDPGPSRLSKTPKLELGMEGATPSTPDLVWVDKMASEGHGPVPWGC